MVSIMRFTLPHLLCLFALVAMGCQAPEKETSPPPPKSTEKAAEPSEVAQAASPVEMGLRMAKHAFKRADVKVTDTQLESIVSSGYEAFDTTQDPKVRVFVFHYDAKELVKPAKVARWISESGLVHNFQTSANRLRIVVAGTPEKGPVDEETTRVMNDFMDAFMVMR